MGDRQDEQVLRVFFECDQVGQPLDGCLADQRVYCPRARPCRVGFRGVANSIEHTVHEVWERAQSRRADDPDGAITLARTLLETVCKHILTEQAVAYDEGDELPRLYRLTAESLRIAPNDATADAFRRIFGACTSIVGSLGTIRNRMGDAHGRGADALRVEPRYARLAVNLSGAMATFLVETIPFLEDAVLLSTQPLAL